MAYRPQDQLVSGLSNNDRRSLLDIASGGVYKTSKDLPSFSELLGVIAEYQAEEMSKEVGGGVTQGNLYEIVMGTAGIVKTASTAARLFSGWRDNLAQYMSKAPKRESKLTDFIIRKAMERVDTDDIKSTQNVLGSINKEFGLGGKVVVPRIEGAAGGSMRQATKKRGAQMRKQTKGEKWRRQEERKAEIAAKKLKQTGDEPYHRGTLKLE